MAKKRSVPQPIKRPRRVMDKISDRQRQESEMIRLLNGDLLDIIEMQIESTKCRADQVKQQEQINERLKWIWEKYTQVDSNLLDMATLAKLWRFMAEADGVQIVPMTYPPPKHDKSATDDGVDLPE